MSDYERHVGYLKQITDESRIKELDTLSKGDKYAFEFYLVENNILEVDGDFFDIVDNKLDYWDNYSTLFSEDDKIQYNIQFHNSGTCLQEELADLLKEAKIK